MRPLLRSIGLLALALASGSAHALGLGQLQVKSGLGEPLLAEIPVISSDPSELVDLDAALASPETFTRIGLEPPIGIVADLRFVIGSDAQGRPVIRITTAQPVTQPLLSFLVEVDWGQGKLVREYTASVSTPGSIAAQPAAPVQAPDVEAPTVIERPVAQAPVSQTPATMPSTPPRPQVPAAARPVASAPAPTAATSDYTVRRGDTASTIAARVTPDGATTDQTIVGLLRANPAAFIGGDVNQLRGGSVLRVPVAAELQAVEAREASALVRGYARQWRQARTQPQAPVAAASTAAPAATPPASGRLEIVPPGAGNKARGGTQSGIAAGGEGEMLRQELATTKETLAARDAEVAELKSRVAELEKLQTDQQTLLSMQNSQMAAAQQRQAKPVAQAAAKPAAPAAPPTASPLPWIGGGLLVLLAVGAALWVRRRRASDPVFRAPSDTPRPSIADSFADDPVVAAAPVVEPVPVAEPVPSWERGAPLRARVAAPSFAKVAPVASTLAPANAPANADHVDADVDRLERAQAYLDAGDVDGARRLLGEVADSGDAMARGVAAKMLQDIG